MVVLLDVLTGFLAPWYVRQNKALFSRCSLEQEGLYLVGCVLFYRNAKL
jgi:hypothetical protein